MQKGFSLVEMLIVLAVLGIVAALGVSMMDLDHGRVRSDQAKIATLLERARSITQRYNASTTVEAISSTTIRAQAKTLARLVVWESSATLEYTTFYLQPNTNKAVYTAPFGRMEGVGAQHFEIRSVKYRADIDAIGVTGKVITRTLIPL